MGKRFLSSQVNGVDVLILPGVLTLMKSTGMSPTTSCIWGFFLMRQGIFGGGKVSSVG